MVLRRIAPLVALLVPLALLTACTASTPPAPSPTPSSTEPPAPDPIALPADPRVYFFGDSWTHGATAAKGKGFPQVVGRTLDWSVQVGPDNSGAGFVHTVVRSHPVFPEAAERLRPIHADLIVLQGGLNDGPGPLTNFWSGVTRTIDALEARSDHAPIVLVGPASPDGTIPEGIAAIDNQESAIAKQLGLHYISPLQERWFTPENVADLVDPASMHPSTAGHAYFAGRLAADLKQIVNETAPSAAPTPNPTTE